jgi:hypothetical protein
MTGYAELDAVPTIMYMYMHTPQHIGSYTIPQCIYGVMMCACASWQLCIKVRELLNSLTDQLKNHCNFNHCNWRNYKTVKMKALLLFATLTLVLVHTNARPHLPWPDNLKCLIPCAVPPCDGGQLIVPEGECCPICQFTFVPDCINVFCTQSICINGESVTPEGECCPICRPLPTA